MAQSSKALNQSFVGTPGCFRCRLAPDFMGWLGVVPSFGRLTRPELSRLWLAGCSPRHGGRSYQALASWLPTVALHWSCRVFKSWLPELSGSGFMACYQALHLELSAAFWAAVARSAPGRAGWHAILRRAAVACQEWATWGTSSAGFPVSLSPFAHISVCF